MLEEKANSTFGAYQKALLVTKELEGEIKDIVKEKVALTKKLLRS